MSIREIVFVYLVAASFAGCFGDTLRRSLILDNNGKYSAEWEVNFDTEMIVFSVDVETTGYVGLGISMNPSMAGADIVIGGVRNGEPYFDDYYAPANGLPKRDDSQDWELLSSSESNGRTQLKFSRKLNTCDDVGDVAITEDTQYLIWAMGDSDDVSYHGADPNKRGPRINNLLDAPTPAADLTQYDIFSIRRNHEMLPQDTSYWCTVHRAPDFNGTKHHLVAFNTTLTSELAIRHTHHLVLYACTPPEGQWTDYFEELVNHPGGECFSENADIPGMSTPYCDSLLYIWAVGGEMLVLPEIAGYPIGEHGRQYFMIEVHIDNPGLETGTFETGIDLFYTSKLRDIDASVFGIAHTVNHLQIVPPRTDNFINVGHCSSECTQALIPEEGINLINVMFHAHKAGKRMKTRIIRNGVELPWLAVDNHYNFDYQANRPFQEYRKVLPGDHIITECTYDTTSRPNVTIGGHPSSYEMCQSFFWHYPKSIIFCDSTANPDLNELFGIEDYEASEFNDEPILTKPESIAGKRYSDYLNTYDWTDELKDQLQQQLRYGTHETRCLGSVRSVQYPDIRQEHVEYNVCAGGDNITTKSFKIILLFAFVTLLVTQLNYL
ncbi:hypothetical protein HA402_003860 [Bradysia odoriphaga]|nr:hypothetical protein HA402_003860 [Bradysia odoriphaga]